MAIDLPTVVLTTQAETRPSSMTSLSIVMGKAYEAFGSWEKASGYRAVSLPPRAAPVPLPIDPTRGERLARIELGLRDARAVLDLGDVTRVDALRAALAIVYGDAREHPEDPEAGALVAEALRMLARTESLAGDVEGAAALRARARTLDGGRLLGLSEGAETAVEKPSTVSFAFVLENAPNGVHVRIDGRIVPTNDSIAAALSPGEHHLRVTMAGDTESLDGPPLYAAFFVVGDRPDQSLRLRVGPPAVPCSEIDLETALESLSKTSTATFSVQCPRWARVVRIADAAVEVRLCGPTNCGEKSAWAATSAPLGGNPPPGKDGSSVWRSPWTYVAIGAAAVIASGLTAWRLGAFDRAEAPPPTWRWDGVGAR